MSQPRRQTFDRWVLLSLMPAPGWHAIYAAPGGGHFTTPLGALALAERRIRYCDTGERLREDPTCPDEELREVVGLAYDPGGLWEVCEEASNYCGLLPPSLTLEDFIAAVPMCQAHAVKPQEDAS
jgi:hypothetical protein